MIPTIILMVMVMVMGMDAQVLMYPRFSIGRHELILVQKLLWRSTMLIIQMLILLNMALILRIKIPNWVRIHHSIPTHKQNYFVYKRITKLRNDRYEI